MLPAGKYVVEVVVPPGYELVKEEDKNILIGDNFIAPVTAQFGGARQYLHPARPGRRSARSTTPTTPQNPTQTLGPHDVCRVTRATPEAWRRSGHAWVQRASFPTSSACSRSRAKWRRSPERRATCATARKSRWMTRARRWRSSGSSPRRTPPPTSPASSPTTSLRNSIRSRRSSARSSRRPTCRFRSRTGPAPKSRACTPTSGAPTTA